MWGDANDQRDPGAVFAEMFKRTIAALNDGLSVVYDATNLMAKTRKATLEQIIKATKVPLRKKLVFIACSIPECKRRQKNRERKVPDAVIDRMAYRFEAPWYNEGWDNIWVSDGGEQYDIDAEHERLLLEPHDNHHHSLTIGEHCVQCKAAMRRLFSNNHYLTDFSRRLMEEVAYQHDLGKLVTKKFENRQGQSTTEAHYYNHNNIGAYIWLSGNKKNYWVSFEFLLIGALIQWHMQPYFSQEKSKEKFEQWAIRKGFTKFFIEGAWLLHECDLAAH